MGTLEVGAGDFADSGFARLAVAPPAAEWRAGVLVLDCAPQAAGAVELSALGGGEGEKTDGEDATRTVAQLFCDR